MLTCMYVRIHVSAYVFMRIVYFQCVQSNMPIEMTVSWIAKFPTMGFFVTFSMSFYINVNILDVF